MAVLRVGIVVLVLSAAACSSSSKPAQTTAAAVRVEVTSLGPVSRGVGLDYQVTNDGGREGRFTYDDLVLTAPDGSEHRVGVGAGDAGYRLIEPRGTYVSGATFVFEPFMPGRYRVTYAGKVLVEKDL